MAALASSTAGPDALYQSLIGALGTEAANASKHRDLGDQPGHDGGQQPGLDLRREPESAGGRRPDSARTRSRRHPRRSTPSTSPSSRSSRRCDVGVADISLSQAITQQLNQQEQQHRQPRGAGLVGPVAQQAVRQPGRRHAGAPAVLQASQLTNWQANTQTATSWLGMGNDAVNSVLDDMQSAQTLILQALNQGPKTPPTYQADRQQLPGDQRRPAVHGQHPVSRADPSSPGRRRRARPTTRRATTWGTTTPRPSSSARAAPRVRRPRLPCRVHRVRHRRRQRVLRPDHRHRPAGTGAPTATQLNTALTALDANISTAEQASAVLGNGSIRSPRFGVADHAAHDGPEHPGRLGGRQRGRPSPPSSTRR